MDLGFGITVGNVTFAWTFLAAKLPLVVAIAGIPLVVISAWQCFSVSRTTIKINIISTVVVALMELILLTAEIMTGRSIGLSLALIVILGINLLWQRWLMKSKEETP